MAFNVTVNLKSQGLSEEEAKKKVAEFQDAFSNVAARYILEQRKKAQK